MSQKPWNIFTNECKAKSPIASCVRQNIFCLTNTQIATSSKGQHDQASAPKAHLKFSKSHGLGNYSMYL